MAVMAWFQCVEYFLTVLFVMTSQIIVPTGGSSLTTTAATPVGIAAYRRFHANESLIGKAIPCTHEEKVCLRYNVLYVPSVKRCWNKIVSYSCDFLGNGQEFNYGSGHLFAVCPGYEDPCPGYRMAFDGKCYPKEVVQQVLCGCDAEPKWHFLGGYECQCSPPTEVPVQQPAEDGKCRVPDMRFPDDRERFREAGSPHAAIERKVELRLGCSAEQARCFLEDQLWVRGECTRLWQRGPCPAEHLAVLDAAAALEGRAEGVCVHVRGGCPPGRRRMAFDGRCYADADLELMRTGQLFFTAYGNLVWTPSYNSERNFLLSSNATNECIVHFQYGDALSPGRYPKPSCGGDDQSKCSLYEVESALPDPLSK